MAVIEKCAYINYNEKHVFQKVLFHIARFKMMEGSSSTLVKNMNTRMKLRTNLYTISTSV